ncbi:MAG TPA: hypothetical protein VMV43_06395 [Candidatus Nanopelagicaceae bacterium]|jgi:hypothetical protein|nr:hypothetical protein [Candidatus Nanopelagicaceae bacterium]
MTDFKAIVESSYDNGTPLWIYTSDYIFGMVPVDANGARWKEVSYTYEEPENPLFVTERTADLSFQFLLEEVEKGVSFYVEDLKIIMVKEYAKTLEGKPGPEKMNAIINELMNNSTKYSSNLPIIKNKDEIGTLISKV